MVEILHQDAQLAVLNKPPGLSLLADRSGAACLWDMLPELLGYKPYLVHRLDKPTSGVMLVALNVECQRRLTRNFSDRAIRKFYLAWVVGHPPHRGLIDLPLKKGRKSRYRVAGQRADIQLDGETFSLANDVQDGHPSITRFRTLKQEPDRSLLLLQPLTGRTHQLRVHLSWTGFPILGDALYGKPASASQQSARLQLHSHRIVIPASGDSTTPRATHGQSFAARTTVDWLD